MHDEPFSSVLELGSGSRGVRRIALIGTLVLHSLVVGIAASSLVELSEFARDVQADVRARLRTQYEFAVARSRPRPKPPKPAKPEPEPPKATARAAVNRPPPPPPPVAEAPNIMALKPDPNAPVDLTGDGIVVGNSDVIASGWVSSKGASVRPSTVRPAASGVRGGRGKVAAPQVTEDLSRPPRLLTPELIQNCGFPPEADAEQVDFGTVQLVVNVGSNDTVGEVTILSESPSGLGFGRRAKSCASRARFDAARDRQGRQVAQSVRVTVKFTRPR